jgi:hypothetical protein
MFTVHLICSTVSPDAHTATDRRRRHALAVAANLGIRTSSSLSFPDALFPFLLPFLSFFQLG